MLGANTVSAFFSNNKSKDINTPAILGGAPVVSSAPKPKWPKWPMWVPSTDEPRVLEVLRSGVWSRAGVVDEFESAWAKPLAPNAV